MASENERVPQMVGHVLKQGEWRVRLIHASKTKMAHATMQLEVAERLPNSDLLVATRNVQGARCCRLMMCGTRHKMSEGSPSDIPCYHVDFN